MTDKFEIMNFFFFKFCYFYYSDLSSLNLTIEINFTKELKYEMLLKGFLKHLKLIIYILLKAIKSLEHYFFSSVDKLNSSDVFPGPLRVSPHLCTTPLPLSFFVPLPPSVFSPTPLIFQIPLNNLQNKLRLLQ